jgi:hypothetical protein
VSTVLNDLSHNGMIDEAFPELFCRKRGVSAEDDLDAPEEDRHWLARLGSAGSVHPLGQSGTVPWMDGN